MSGARYRLLIASRFHLISYCIFPAFGCNLCIGPPSHFAVFSPGAETVTHPAEPEALISVINSCDWLIQYYKRRGVAPESLQLFRDTMDKAANDLVAFKPSTPSEVSCH